MQYKMIGIVRLIDCEITQGTKSTKLETRNHEKCDQVKWIKAGDSARYKITGCMSMANINPSEYETRN